MRSTDVKLFIGKGLQGTFPYDFAIYYDKDDYLARLLEQCGVRLFNRAEGVRLADDKMLTHIALAPYVRQPDTIPSPLFFAGEDDPAFLDRVERALGYPVVVKQCFGAFGRQVRLVRDREELSAIRAALLREPHLYQRYIECGATDYRVITVGGKAVAAMKRRATAVGEFRANAELGGMGERIDLDPETRALAETASRVLGLEYAGVDLIKDEEGYLVTEVNSNAHFKLIEKVTGINVAALYAEYVLSAIAEGGEV